MKNTLCVLRASTSNVIGISIRSKIFAHSRILIFSIPEYSVHDVVVHEGVSDHCALSANVSRVL